VKRATKDAKAEPLDPPLKPGEMMLIVHRARGLAAADSNGKSDPYAKIRVDNGTGPPQTFKTQTINRALDPVWNKSFTIDQVLDATTSMSIVVKDADWGLQSESLGQVDFGRGKSRKMRTDPSSTPSATNPTYLTTLDMKPPVPKNQLMVSPLTFNVYDSLFGGLRQPLPGTTTVDMAEQAPRQRMPDGFFSSDGA